MWKVWNSHALLMGMKNSAANLENNLAITQMIKHGVAINSPDGYRCKINENMSTQKLIPRCL